MGVFDICNHSKSVPQPLKQIKSAKLRNFKKLKSIVVLVVDLLWTSEVKKTK